MLKTNNNFKKYRIPLVSSVLGISGMLLLLYLTFIPVPASAESLIVDPNEHRSLSQIDTMQEMSQQICINSREEETKQLRDTRDNKTYWVAKLKDGNCWMTQNLDYDGGGNRIGAIAEWKNVLNTTAAYYDPGEYYYTNQSRNSVSCTNIADLAACIGEGPGKGFSFIPATAATKDIQHYHVGNYYSWAAANDTSSNTGQASSSICPAKWTLPSSYSSGGGDFGDFPKLMLEYGWTSNNPSNIADTMNDGRGVYGDPLYFVYGGYLRYDGALYDGGSSAFYWSSTPKDSTHAYSLQAYTGLIPYYSNLDTSNGNRHRGMSVRCLATGGWLDSYPDPVEPADNQASVSITVSPVISIDVTKHADDMTVDFTQVAKSSIIARVGSNQGYQVLISTEQSNLEQSPIVENQHIPMITTDQKISAGTSGWGIKKLSSPTDTTVTADTIYSPIGLGENKALFYTSNTPASEDLTFPVAIAVDSTLPSGQYSTQVTLTAVAM